MLDISTKIDKIIIYQYKGLLQVRVISGMAKGTKLESIDSLSTRPTLDRVKEALFNIIQPYIQDAKVLDLFAGSGALGIEALSRGAKHCVFCEKSHEAIQKVRSNIQKTHLESKALILQTDYRKCLQEMRGEVFNIIFLDPPYRFNIAVEAVERIAEEKLLAKDGIIVIETDDEKREIQELEKINIEVKDIRKYGRVKLLFLVERG